MNAPQQNDDDAAAVADIDVVDEGNKTQDEVYRSLLRLLECFTQTATPPQQPLSHWRELDNDIQQAYQLISQGAEYIKSTSTKYTLMGKSCSSSQHDKGSHYELALDLLRGAEQVAAGAFFLLQNNSGCGRSCKSFLREGIRATMASLASLVEVFLPYKNEQAIQESANRKTGALWESCDALFLIPKGNRSAIRRELLGWMRDSVETMQEFQALLEHHPPLEEDAVSKELQKFSFDNNDDKNSNEEEWQAFCTGEEEALYYTVSERGIAESCLRLIKCSRGTIALTLEACESAGEMLSTTCKDQESILQWIGELSENCKIVGEGVTNLGMELYPSLQLDSLLAELNAQRDALFNLQNCILNCRDRLFISLSDIKVKASKLARNSEERYRQAKDAMEALMQSNSVA